MGSKNSSGMLKKEYLGRTIVSICGILIIVLTLIITIFLIVKGSGTFTTYHHSIGEFLFSDNWSPSDVSGKGGG